MADVRIKLTPEVVSFIDALDEVSKRFGKVEKAVGDVSKTSDEASSEVLSHLDKMAKRVKTNTEKIQQTVQKGATAIKRNLSDVSKSAAKDIAKTGVAVERSTNSMADRFRRMGNRIKSVFGLAKNELDEFGEKTDDVNRSTRKFFGGIQNLAGVAGIAGIGVAAKKTFDSMRNFEFGLAKVSTLILGDASDAIKQYEERLISMSSETGASLDELTDALFKVISSSVEGSETIEGATQLLDVAVRAGVAGAADTATAVSALTTILNSYNMTAADASRVSDQLFTIARLGQTSFEELAPAIGPVIGIAAQAGVEFNQLGAAMIALTKGGLKTDLAITALRSVITEALTPTNQLTNAFRQTFKDFTSTADILSDPKQGLVRFMEMLREVTGGNAEEMSKLIPNIRGLQGVATLAGTGIDGMIDGLNEMRKSTGAVDDAYNKMSNTMEMRTRRLVSNIEIAAQSIGNMLGTMVFEFGQFIGKSLGYVVVEVGKVLEKTGRAKLYTNPIKETRQEISRLEGELKKAGIAFNKYLVPIFDRPAVDLPDVLPPVAPITKPRPKILTDEERKRREALQKKRVSFLRQLKQIELAGLDEISRIRESVEVKISEMRKRGGFRATELATAAGLLREQAENKVDSLLSRRENEQNARIDNMHSQRMQNEKMIDDLVRRKYRFETRSESEIIKMREDIIDREMAARADAMRGLKTTSLDFFGTFDGLVSTSIDNMLKDRVRAEIASGQIAASEWSDRLTELTEEFEANWKKIVDGGKRLLGELGDLVSSIYGSIFGKLQNQINDVINAVMTAAAEGEKLLILTDEARAQAERDIGRALTEEEARGRAVAMTPAELGQLQAEGKIGEFEQVGVESPMERVEPLIDRFVSVWENLANNLDGILEWVVNEAAPRIINAFIESLPAIFMAINNAIKTAIPFIVDAIIDIVLTVMENLPDIVAVIIQGIMTAFEKLIERLPELIDGIIRMMPRLIDSILSMVIQGIPKITAEIISQLPSIIKSLIIGIFTEFIPMLAKSIWDAIKSAFSFWDWFHTGGVVGGAHSMHDGGYLTAFHNAIKAHDGRFMAPELRSDEVPIIAQVGEGILNREATARIGGESTINAINRGEDLGSRVSNNVTNVFELKADMLLASDASTVIDEMLSDNFRQGQGKLVDIVKKDVAGFKPAI